MLEKVTTILKDYIGDESVPITADSSLVNDLGLSSLDVINLVLTFEEEFDIEIPERILPTMHTVGDIVSYLEKKNKEKA